MPDGGNRDSDIELYSEDRYFTVTGHHLDLTPGTVNDRTDALAAIHADYIADDTGDPNTAVSVPDGGADTQTAADLADDDLIEYALNASNGDKFERLWNGDTSGYPSHSEADQALCNMLAFWTGGDPQQIERLFSQSGLARDKWSERSDYRDRTIQKAIRDCPAFYDPSNDD